MTDQAGPRVVVHSRPGCHLCEVAIDVVRAVSAETGVSWAERSILDDPAAYAAFVELIPVVEVDGEVVATWRVEADRLRDILQG